MTLRDRLVSNLRLQASRARVLAQGTSPGVRVRLLQCADELESQALALEALPSETSDDMTRMIAWPPSDDNG